MDKGHQKVQDDAMLITKQTVAQQLAAYQTKCDAVYQHVYDVYGNAELKHTRANSIFPSLFGANRNDKPTTVCLWRHTPAKEAVRSSLPTSEVNGPRCTMISSDGGSL